MERLATQKLIEWNKSTNRKPLIVWGESQVGKTYLVKDIFADKYYTGIEGSVNVCRSIYILAPQSGHITYLYETAVVEYDGTSI